MNNLGRILLILFIPFILKASVVLNAPDSFYKGELVEFSITVSGTDIEIPDINSISGVPVETLGTSRQTNIINGKRKDKITKSYVLIAKKDITIPPFKIKVDGKIQKTEAKTLKAIKVEKTVSNLYSLDIKVDNEAPYVGEAINFSLLFKYKKDLDILSLEFEKPKFEDFWVKELQPEPLNKTSDGYVEQKLSYLLFPQKAAKLELGALKIGVVTRDGNYQSSFFMTTSTKTIPVYSNTINLDIKQLPQNLKLVGDFNIKSVVNKKQIKQGEAVSYKIIIDGFGNLDDIDEIKLKLPNSTIYENPATKKYKITNGKYGGVYTKVFSIVATKDFTIPSIELSFFDKKTKSVKTIKTKSYDIKVQKVKKQKTKLEVDSNYDGKKSLITKPQTTIKEVVKITNIQKGSYFIFGLLAGIIVTIFVVVLVKNRKTKKDETPLIKKVKQSKNSQELLKLLVGFINIDKDLDKMIYKLEHRVDKAQFVNIKKEMIKYLKNKNIK